MFVYVRRRKWVRIRKLKVNMNTLPSSPQRRQVVVPKISTSSSDYLQRAQDLIDRAVEARQAGELGPALTFYEEGIAIMLAGLKRK